MKKSMVGSMYSRLTTFSLVVSLLVVQTALGFTSTREANAAAEIVVTGQKENGERAFVVVNGEQAFSGRTFFSNGTIETTEASSATINLGKLGRVDLAPSSSLTLSFSEGRIGGTLEKGNITVSNTAGVAVTIKTPDDSIKNEGNARSSFSVAVKGERSGVAVASGKVSFRNGTEIAVGQDDDDDDDDDDDHWMIWATVALVAGAVTLVVLLNRDDDEDTVSPVR